MHKKSPSKLHIVPKHNRISSSKCTGRNRYKEIKVNVKNTHLSLAFAFHFRKISTILQQQMSSPEQSSGNSRFKKKMMEDSDAVFFSDDEVTDITEKKVLEKTIPCPSCDVKFATNMSLKMHINLQHPVKAEASADTD